MHLRFGNSVIIDVTNFHMKFVMVDWHFYLGLKDCNLSLLSFVYEIILDIFYHSQQSTFSQRATRQYLRVYLIHCPFDQSG